MAVTPDPPKARDLVSGRASRAPSESPYVPHSAPASDKPVNNRLDQEARESTISNETEHRSVQPLSGRAFLDHNSLPRWPADGEREPVAGGCHVYASRPPDQTPARHFTRAFCVDGHFGWGIQIYSERPHTGD